MLSRRGGLLGAASAVVLAGAARVLGSASAAATERFEVEHSDAEWRQRLSAEQYDILRQQGTERPFSSPLDHEHRAGIFACAGCDLSLFSSATKFDSHTGWPSFWKPLDDAVTTSRDTSYFMVRTEVHCRRCGGHLGHVFNDGPPPTGLRYCMNGRAMVFKPAAGDGGRRLGARTASGAGPLTRVR